MARLTNYGKYILSAGEIGSYTVCPEAWRLKTIEQVQRAPQQSVEDGQRLHTEWAAHLDESIDLARILKWIVLIVSLAIAVYLVSR
ncbi:MAG: hypothetical protein K1X83_13725 [Oligoflexia bacterium]|nr:hypothetical protein [Oligoflexia bacterium]